MGQIAHGYLRAGPIGYYARSYLEISMPITVKFFASLREQLKSPVSQIDSAGITTVADVWAAAADIPIPDHVLCSVNLDHCTATDSVKDGDEVAFFPPITGG